MINIRVICPSSSFKESDSKDIDLIVAKLEEKGFNVTFGKNVYKKDDLYGCASIEERINDLTDAFSDSSVDIILCGRGGFNVNQLLPYIDYELIKNNEKIICGMSDNTALLIVLFTQSNLQTYLGPNFINLLDDDNLNNFIEMINNKKYVIPIENENIIEKGVVEGKIIGGNLCTLNLLQGTSYLKDVKDVILFIEDDDNYKPGAFFKEFDRNLESLLQCNKFDIKGIVFGKFEESCEMNRNKIENLIRSKKQLQRIPVIMDFDIGHVFPILTIPIGGKCIINNGIVEINTL